MALVMFLLVMYRVFPSASRYMASGMSSRGPTKVWNRRTIRRRQSMLAHDGYLGAAVQRDLFAILAVLLCAESDTCACD